MLTMRSHDVEDYVSLRDMDVENVGTLNENDLACLDELGQYLVSTDAFHRFGIWLLHKHFEPAEGEVFVERSLVGSRGTETAPIARPDGSADDLMPTSVRFDSATGSGVGVIGMEYAAPEDFGSISPLSADDETTLAGIADLLQAYGKTERFGVRLLRDPIGISDDEVFLETCDMAQRTLNCAVIERRDLPSYKTIQTTWEWTPGLDGSGPTSAPGRVCIYYCLDDPGHSYLHT